MTSEKVNTQFYFLRNFSNIQFSNDDFKLKIRNFQQIIHYFHSLFYDETDILIPSFMVGTYNDRQDLASICTSIKKTTHIFIICSILFVKNILDGTEPLS